MSSGDGKKVNGVPKTPWAPGTVVVAKYQFKGSATHDLPFGKGDRLTIVSASRDPNWYKARREDGLEGMLPANFVMEVKAEALTVKKEAQKKPPKVSQDSLPKTAVQLHKMPWFHGKISRSEAEVKLNPMQNGLYLVRESTNFPGDYALCVCFTNKIEHYHIKFKDNMYTIDDEEEFDNLTQMVEHYQKDADGLVTRLRVPVAKEGKQQYTVEMDDFKKHGWNIPRDRLEFGATIGKGEFGEVFSGKYKGEKVAIKSLKDDHKGLQDFLAEASVMTSLSHPNLVNLIGVSVDQKPVYIITEFMEKGSLIEYLRSRGRSVIQRSHQIGFAKDVVNGMAYLERKDLVHRDLAARNILVSAENVAKVSDFSLARERDYDHKGVKIPIKWTAPEAIESGEFSNKSDVWSFGILMWEVYSFGRVPYPRVPVNDVMAHIKRGGRLELPENCPPEVYSIMKSCWRENPEDRPKFSEIKKELKALPASVGKP
jgi:c-src tyrosine kinase